MKNDCILCIETTTEICSVALVKGEALIALQEHTKGYTHATVLTVLIAQVLSETNLGYEDLKAIAISSGPGSYTGLRIGTATAKGLCYALNIPLLPIPTLQALAQQTVKTQNTSSSSLYISIMDARRMDVYLAAYDCDLREVIPTQAITLTEQTFDKYTSVYSNVFVMGNAVEKCQQIITAKKQIHFLPLPYFSAANLIVLAAKAYQQGVDKQVFTDIAYYEPYYLKEYLPNKKQKKIL